MRFPTPEALKFSCRIGIQQSKGTYSSSQGQMSLILPVAGCCCCPSPADAAVVVIDSFRLPLGEWLGWRFGTASPTLPLALVLRTVSDAGRMAGGGSWDSQGQTGSATVEHLRAGSDMDSHGQTGSASTTSVELFRLSSADDRPPPLDRGLLAPGGRTDSQGQTSASVAALGFPPRRWGLPPSTTGRPVMSTQRLLRLG